MMKSKLESLNISRRDLVRSAALMGIAPHLARAAKNPLFPAGVLLFQGDSITDAHRDRERRSPNDSAGLGQGYPLLVAAHLLGSRAEDGLRVYNRGISGNKVPDLEAPRLSKMGRGASRPSPLAPFSSHRTVHRKRLPHRVSAK